MTREEAKYTLIHIYGQCAWGSECEEYGCSVCEDALNMAIEALQTEGVGRYEKAMEILREMPRHLSGIKEKQIKKLKEQKPKTGEWIESKERSKHWYCSVCGGIHTDPETGKWRETFDYRYPFCPNCGADMRGEEE